ncbi:MAG: cation diffusion facilitator family transporter [Deferribacterota bacterium]|nr:cation diffusion facilitator family transporter [Deferribacterota bacterium]
MENNNRWKPLKYSLFLSTFLSLLKIIVGLLINSLAIIASAVDNIMDIISSTFNMLALKKSDEPPDSNHKYGHSKFEPLATYTQALILIATSLFIFYRAIVKIYRDQPVKEINVGVIVMLISLISTLFLIIYLNKKAKEYNSNLLKAETLHYKTDVFTNIGIIITLIAINFWDIYFLDPIISLAITIYILYEAIKLLLESVKELTDSEVPFNIEESINSIINEKFYNEVANFHNLRTRKAGNKIFIDMHITLNNNPTITKAHKIVNSIEDKIKGKYKNADVTIHIEPSNKD